jgi:hypothetical protein
MLAMAGRRHNTADGGLGADDQQGTCGMTWLKIILAGVVNGVLVGLLFRWLMLLFPVLSLGLLVGGAGGGVAMGPVLWALSPRNSVKRVSWRRVGIALALADVAIIPLAIPAAWLVGATGLDEGLYGIAVFLSATWVLWAFLSLAIATRVLRDGDVARR